MRFVEMDAFVLVSGRDPGRTTKPRLLVMRRGPVKLIETQQRGSGQCDALYLSPPSPREVAGASLAGDIVKCQLNPVDPNDYAVSFSLEEMDRLRRIFPAGVRLEPTRRGPSESQGNPAVFLKRL